MTATNTYDVIVVGGGHNGLINAAYLARAGLRVVVLERRHLVGGAAVTEEIFAGFKYSVASYVVSLLRPEIIRDLQLARHGLEILPLGSTVTPLPNGDYLGRWADHDQTRRELYRHSPRDAEAYDDFATLMYQLAWAVKPLLGIVPPDPLSPGVRDLRTLLELGRHVRGLDERQFHALFKLGTMSAADYLDEWFESDVLKATMSASGIIGTFLGPRSPGTAYVLLHHYMGEIDGVFRAWGFAKGGNGMVSESIASAARAHGAEIRTLATVDRVLTRHGRAAGVVLEDGEELRATTVVSGVDPKRTFLDLLDPEELPRELVDAIRRFRIRGSSGKVNLSLAERPEFACLPGDGPHLRGAFSISPSVDYLERAYDDAKYGGFSRRPYMDIVIPSMIDPGMAPPGRHVMSIFVQYAAFDIAGGWDNAKREAFGDAVVDTLAEYVPNLRDSILHRQVLTPLDMQEQLGLTEGNIFHGELTPQQLFFFRPSPAWADYRTPVRGFYQCGSGTHPGGGVCGASGRLAALEILERPAAGAPVSRYDAIVIGAGHNGLIAATYLARAGLRVVIVERREAAGGCAATEELWPGYRVDTGAHSLTGLDPRVVADLDLAGAGLQILSPDPCVVSPQPEGEALILEADPAPTADRIRRFSARDAARWPDFVAAMSRVSQVLALLYRTLPPRIAGADRADLWELLRLGARLGRVGRRDALELMRLIPMTVEELLYEWFESEALKGALAADGVRGMCQGPLASGTGYMFLHGVGADGVVRRRRQVRGGMGELGSVLQRVAAAAGAEIRLGHGVASICVEDGRATGIELAGGERISAPCIVSNADPGRTLLGLVDPGELAPEFVRALDNIKYRGVCAKVHLALGEPPSFRTGDSAARAAVLAGSSITIAPSVEYIERAYDDAKYGRTSSRPVVDAVLTSALDPGLAPEGRHVLSAVAQYAPFDLADGPWDATRREALGDAVIATLAAHAPNLEAAILHRHVLTSADLADRFALPEGNIYHGEMTLDQVFFGRPVGGWARYRTPIAGLYLCGAGTHPGGGLNGRPGAAAAARILRHRKRRR